MRKKKVVPFPEYLYSEDSSLDGKDLISLRNVYILLTEEQRKLVDLLTEDAYSAGRCSGYDEGYRRGEDDGYEFGYNSCKESDD